jgi:antitoxin PrlF
MLSTVTSKGQVTLPKALRDRLGIVPGTSLDFVIDGAGNLVARPLQRDPMAVCGLLQRPGQAPVSVEEMDEAVAERGP